MGSVVLDCSEYELSDFSRLEPDSDAASLQLDECSDDEVGSGDEEEEATVADGDKSNLDEVMYFRSNRKSLRRVMRKLGFQTASGLENIHASVIWNLLRAVTREGLARMEPWQRQGTIKGCNQFNNKLTLHRAVRDHELRAAETGDGVHVMPRGFHANRDRKKLEKHCALPEMRGAMWICKPCEAAMGQGIFVCHNTADLWYQLSARKKYCHQLLVSEYVRKPLLLTGHKFDLRVYCLVVSMNPLRVYIYNEGLVRYATTPYSSTSRSAQLTNFSLNRNERNFRNATSMDDCNPQAELWGS